MCGKLPGLIALFLVLVVSSCEDTSPTARVTLEVSPLSLEGVVDATWSIAVASSAGPVFSVTVSSSRYGAEGGISYIGPCDADAGENTVTLVLESLETDTTTLVDGVDYVNPAPADAPLEQRILCRENADVAVRFDVTVARSARQGFFDVAVTFDDIFCSAKLDCKDDLGVPLDLLFDPITGERATTAVVAFACTGGLGATTELCLDPFVITCDNGGPFVIDPAAGLGRLGGVTVGDHTLVYDAAVYRGTESLTQGGVSWGKAYWNVAIGLDPDAFAGLGVCTLVGAGTATSAPFPERTTPADTRWPIVTWQVPLTDGDAGLEGLACSQHPLDVEGSLVKTIYTEARTFGACYRSHCQNGVLDGDEADIDCGGSCAPCDDGEQCVVPEDCLSKQCPEGFCEVASCDDGVRNGDELGVDCGGSCPVSCFSADTLYEVLTAHPELGAGYYTFVIHGEPVEIEYLVFGSTVVTTPTALGDAVSDERLVVARYDGDLTVAAGGSLTTSTRKKGLVMWVRGELDVAGSILMTARGAKGAGQELWLYRPTGGDPVVLPAVGGTGGAAIFSSNTSLNGQDGASGVPLGGPGGGGSGAAHCNTCLASSGSGSAATSWSGGSGGGGVSRWRSSGNGGNAAPWGAAGGVASAYHPNDGFGKAAGGGAGNPGGAGRASGLGSGAAGSNGTGGLLVIFAEDGLRLAGTIESKGSPGGVVSSGSTQWNAGGGGSGGGAIYAFFGGPLDLAGGSASAAGGAGGQGSCHVAQCMAGGDGGEGFVSLEPFVPCATCGRCTTPADCPSGVCTLGFCAAPTCDDGVLNGDETCVDAGGSCPTRCPAGDTFYDALVSDPTLADGEWNLVANGTVFPIESRAFGPTTISATTQLGSAAADARSLVVRYDGDLTIQAGATLTAAARKRGMFVWVRGDLTVDGSLSMTARGANASGVNVPLVRRADDSIVIIPASGEAGGAARSLVTNGVVPGLPGVSNALLGTGGGGSGGAHANSCNVTSGAGRPGTSWSGGSGGGGVSRISTNGNAGAGVVNGGAGGGGSANQPGPTFGKSGGGGAGNNGGAAASSGNAACTAAAGQAGTGGLLVIYVEGDVSVSGSVTAHGTNGGGTAVNGNCWGAGGGGSGGGSVNLFHRGTRGGAGTFTASGGSGGNGYCGTPTSSNCMNGGAGGAGSVLIDELP